MSGYDTRATLNVSNQPMQTAARFAFACPQSVGSHCSSLVSVFMLSPEQPKLWSPLQITKNPTLVDCLDQPIDSSGIFARLGRRPVRGSLVIMIRIGRMAKAVFLLQSEETLVGPISCVHPKLFPLPCVTSIPGPFGFVLSQCLVEFLYGVQAEHVCINCESIERLGSVHRANVRIVRNDAFNMRSWSKVVLFGFRGGANAV